jgi:hypothetical protein
MSTVRIMFVALQREKTHQKHDVVSVCVAQHKYAKKALAGVCTGTRTAQV